MFDGEARKQPSVKIGGQSSRRRRNWCVRFSNAVEMQSSSAWTFEDRERAALALGNVAVREYLESNLQELSDGLDTELHIDGVHHKVSHEAAQGEYHSLCGTLNVMRSTYRPVGKRNAKTVVPLELAAGIVERATPALAYSVALGYATSDSRAYVETQKASHRDVPSRSTVERMAKAVGAKARTEAPVIERYLRQGKAERIPSDARAVSLGLDRTSVPYEEPHDPKASCKTGRKSRTKPYVRAKPGPVDVNYRMDYVGTVSVLGSDGDKVIARKYFASHAEGPQGILQRMVADVRAAKRQRPDLAVGIVQDAARELWTLLRDALGGDDTPMCQDRCRVTECGSLKESEQQLGAEEDRRDDQEVFGSLQGSDGEENVWTKRRHRLYAGGRSGHCPINTLHVEAAGEYGGQHVKACRKGRKSSFAQCFATPAGLCAGREAAGSAGGCRAVE